MSARHFMAFDLFQSDFEPRFDGFMLVVECDTESDGHEFRVATPCKLPQNIQVVLVF